MKCFKAVVITCEHATAYVPPALRHLFRGQSKLLASHRGFDRGAWKVALYLAKHLDAPVFGADVSRLVIDHNRSLTHASLHGEAVSDLSREERQQLIQDYYEPFRARVYKALERAQLRRAPVLHLSIHSFTPVLNGKRRIAEFGLLYDPRRPLEAELCRRWQVSLAHNEHGWRVRRNYPYVGWTDGHTTALRQQFPHSSYAGVEVEINQSLTEPRQLQKVAALLRSTLTAFVPS